MLHEISYSILKVAFKIHYCAKLQVYSLNKYADRHTNTHRQEHTIRKHTQTTTHNTQTHTHTLSLSCTHKSTHHTSTHSHTQEHTSFQHKPSRTYTHIHTHSLGHIHSLYKLEILALPLQSRIQDRLLSRIIEWLIKLASSAVLNLLVNVICRLQVELPEANAALFSVSWMGCMSFFGQ